MIVYFVRHGQTAYNRDGLGLGRHDVELTDLGRRQVQSVARRLAREPMSHIYSSPLARCLDTAKAIAGERGIAIESRDELVELDIGETEGLPFAEMRTRYAEFLREWAGPDGHEARMPGGERLRDLEERLVPFLEGLQDTRPHDAVAIVSHNFVIRIALARLLGLELPAFRSILVDVASVSTVRVRDDGSVLVRALNDRCFLNELEP